jgi:hypothetical protein
MDQQDRFTVRVADDLAAVRNVSRGNALLQVGPGRVLVLIGHLRFLLALVPPEQYPIFQADAPLLSLEPPAPAADRLPRPLYVVFHGGPEHEEIARVMEYPVGMVRARLCRARKMLQQPLWRIVETERIADGPGGAT